jgi:hypothetical protein
LQKQIYVGERDRVVSLSRPNEKKVAEKRLHLRLQDPDQYVGFSKVVVGNEKNLITATQTSS